jgi:Tfp pilus assembly protein PilF
MAKGTAHAQGGDIIYVNPEVSSIKAPIKNALRQEIDGKRLAEDLYSKEALYRGREFQRIDSTYYVGYLFEGIHKKESAADGLGYELSAQPLQKAKDLIEKDYNKILQTRPKDFATYFVVNQYQQDYDLICDNLQECYQYSGKNDKAVEVIRSFMKRDLLTARSLNPYVTLSWIIHRNRFYTSQKFPFLKNSIDSNEALAHKLLDSVLIKAKKDSKTNSMLASYDEVSANHSVAHYRAILYTYANNIDSGKKYYDILQQTGSSNNNYATFLSIQGKFSDAMKHYKIAQDESYGGRQLDEFIYYQALLNNYAAKPQLGIKLAEQKLKANGSTPGFGWYNLALARSLLYDGQIVLAQKYITKAEQFREVHLGTTLGQSHYDFTVSLLKLIAKEKEIAWIKLKQKYWYFNAKSLGMWLARSIEKYTIQYFLINQFANNPERDLVIYKLFSTESTIGYDEVWYLIKDFSTDFFIKKFKSTIENDKRPLISKYFKLYLAKLYLQKKDYDAANSILNELNAGKKDLGEYDKLYLARLNEATAVCATQIGSKEDIINNATAMLENYPQLIPFSTQRVPTIIMYSGPFGKTEQSIISKLRNSNVGFSELKQATAELKLEFREINTQTECVVSYRINDKYICAQRIINYKNANEAVDLIIQAMYSIGSNVAVPEV